MMNILTFDIEEWYEANYKKIGYSNIDSQKSNLENEVKEILYSCEKFGAKATFFILGKVAAERPALVRMIQERGHEIASHGYQHKLVYNLSPQEFKEDVQKSIRLLESITGEKILGYRAPSWSISKKVFWAYPILAELGLKYSASIFPIKTFLYGIPDAPRFPHLINIEGQRKNILEIPASTIKLFNRNIPFSGGFYFRFLPTWLISKGIKKNNKEKQPVILYIHPREIDPNLPKLKLSCKEYFIHYWGISKTKNKLEEILKNFNFTSIKSELLLKYKMYL